ncbi:MAG: DUF1549 domain-containing protein, partial [Gimesia sp.]|nr:DUF1549 domain-containing protein [Gimesia sp.]
MNDAGFLRRLSLDIRGRIPTLTEVKSFLVDDRANKRTLLIDQMLASDQWADGWVGYWQDVLAENPSLVYPTLNNSGAFRQWIYDSFRKNVAIDRFATELLLMEGDQQTGTSGFALAAKNDAPLAMKGIVVMQAFLAVDLKCARCHDSPHDEDLQQSDLFALAALLNEAPINVPHSSIAGTITVRGGEEPLVKTSLNAGDNVAPGWTFNTLKQRPRDTYFALSNRPRSELAMIITSPETPRFAAVIVNRVWQRYLGRGLVESVDNWNSVETKTLDPMLLALAREFVAHGYDLKKIARLIFTSQIYQSDLNAGRASASKYFSDLKPLRRRVTAEQAVDSLFLAVGKEFESEVMGLHATDRGAVNLPQPQRAWQFAAIPNERGRPALA